MGCVNTKESHVQDAVTTQPAETLSVPVSQAKPKLAPVQEAAQESENRTENEDDGGLDLDDGSQQMYKTFQQTADQEPNSVLEELPVTEEVSGIDTDDHVLSLEVPGAGYRITFASLSKRGYYPEAPDKANQDSFLLGPVFGGDPDDHLFGVFDGHGEHGTPCSQFARDRVGQNLLRHRLFKSDVPQAFHGAFVSANAQLHRAHIDDTMSGTTGIAVLLRKRMLYAANVGDSRAVIAERRGKKLVAVDLSNDQTPYREDECGRVKACGARVLTLDQLEGLKNPHVKVWGGDDDDEGDPPRLWVPNGMYPGTAFTRSIGDTVAERIGVTAVPEVLVLPLTEQHPFIILASDGVFEFLSSQAVVDIASRFKSPFDACKNIVDEAYRLWLQYETRTDDITIIVIKLEGLSKPPPSKPGLPSSPSTPAPVGKRRRAIEGSGPEDSQVATWVQPNDVPIKSPQDLARLETAIRPNFLFNSLSEKQRQVLLSSMRKMNVSPGDLVIRQGETGDKFYCCEDGEYEILVSSDNTLGSVVHRYTSGSRPCFGDLALLYETRREASVRAATRGSLWTLDRISFKAVQRMGKTLNPLNIEPFNPVTFLDERLVELKETLSKVQGESPLKAQLAGTQMADLDWEESVLEHEAFQLGRVRHTVTGGILTLKQWYKSQVTELNRSQQPLVEKRLFQLLAPSPFVPSLLACPSSDSLAGLLFDTRIAVPLSLIMSEPLSDISNKFIIASVAAALVDLHKAGVVFRGVGPDTIFLDDHGLVQFADLRFAEPIPSGKSYNMCGAPDYMAPEIISGVGHTFAVDWWALGVLTFTLLTGEGPFGSWKDSELQLYTRISRRQFQIPSGLGLAIDLIDKLLILNPSDRLGAGSGGFSELKEHPWFAGIPWDSLSNKKAAVPPELVKRLAQARKKLPLGEAVTLTESTTKKAVSSQPNWYDGW